MIQVGRFVLSTLRLLISKTISFFHRIQYKLKYLIQIIGELRFFSDIFNDWITRAAGIILILLLINLAFNVFFVHFQQQYPFLQLISLVMVFVFIITGGILFFIAIVKYHD